MGSGGFLSFRFFLIVSFWAVLGGTSSHGATPPQPPRDPSTEQIAEMRAAIGGPDAQSVETRKKAKALVIQFPESDFAEELVQSAWPGDPLQLWLAEHWLRALSPSSAKQFSLFLRSLPWVENVRRTRFHETWTAQVDRGTFIPPGVMRLILDTRSLGRTAEYFLLSKWFRSPTANSAGIAGLLVRSDLAIHPYAHMILARWVDSGNYVAHDLNQVLGFEIWERLPLFSQGCGFNPSPVCMRRELAKYLAAEDQRALASRAKASDLEVSAALLEVKARIQEMLDAPQPWRLDNRLNKINRVAGAVASFWSKSGIRFSTHTAENGEMFLRAAPAGSHPLNLRARELFESRGLRLDYAPHLVAPDQHGGAWFYGKVKRIALGHRTAQFPERINEDLLHERMHSDREEMTERGRYSPFIGGVVSTGPALPGLETVPTYARRLYFDELSTHLREFQFQFEWIQQLVDQLTQLEPRTPEFDLARVDLAYRWHQVKHRAESSAVLVQSTLQVVQRAQAAFLSAHPPVIYFQGSHRDEELEIMYREVTFVIPHPSDPTQGIGFNLPLPKELLDSTLDEVLEIPSDAVAVRFHLQILLQTAQARLTLWQEILAALKAVDLIDNDVHRAALLRTLRSLTWKGADLDDPPFPLSRRSILRNRFSSQLEESLEQLAEAEPRQITRWIPPVRAAAANSTLTTGECFYGTLSSLIETRLRAIRPAQ